jgi:hypothetical protein
MTELLSVMVERLLPYDGSTARTRSGRPRMACRRWCIPEQRHRRLERQDDRAAGADGGCDLRGPARRRVRAGSAVEPPARRAGPAGGRPDAV